MKTILWEYWFTLPPETFRDITGYINEAEDYRPKLICLSKLIAHISEKKLWSVLKYKDHFLIELKESKTGKETRIKLEFDSTSLIP